MVMDYLENILQLTITVVMQLLCLFQYIKYKTRGHICLIAFFLCNLVSSYYWTAYLLIMGDWPNVSDLFSYLGWNASFLTLLALVLILKTQEERRYFHPLMLLPIPLNLYQLTLYLPYGGALNSAYQVIVCTCVTIFSLQSVCWYWKNRRLGAKVPYTAVAALLIACLEFGMWTASCFDWPSDYLNPYYYCSFLCSLDYLFLGWAVNRACASADAPRQSESGLRQQRHLRIAYLAVVLICCVGGLVLGVWMRDMLTVGTRGLAETSVFDIIPVILFVCSMIVVAFAIAIILLVSFSQKAAESDALREAKAVAEQSNASKSEFLANMSHEIRTPINAVLGMNEMVLRESMCARDDLPQDRSAIREAFVDICRYSANIESAGHSLLAIINDILDFSRIESGRLEISQANYELSNVLNDVSNMIFFKAREKGLEFSVSVDERIPNGLYGDELRVRQVLTNLLSNAVKYTDRGGVHMDVRGVAGEGDVIALVISVRDTGIGIRPDDLEKLFTKFQRVDLAHNGTVEGTGLGLAITQSLLDMMGGQIRVESVYRRGSTFTVELPQKVVSREPVGNFKMRFEKNLAGARAYRARLYAPKARVLVVDDTRMNIDVAVGLMKKTGVKVDAAMSGQEAVELARSTAYDLILMDQRMPGMDGTEAMRRIRAQASGANARTPVVCLTADAVIGAKERYLAEGFDDYLSKPIDYNALEKQLIRYIPGNKVTQVKVESARDGSPDADENSFAVPPQYAPLEAAGIDAKEGLRHCQQDEALYRSLLAEYVRSAEQRAGELERFLAERDWANYNIRVHALKSTSGTIGASRLCDIAAQAEAASVAGDGGGVQRLHTGLMARYGQAVDAIRQLNLDEPPMEPEGGGVFEFLPEEQ